MCLIFCLFKTKSNANNYECLETCSDVENISLLKTLAAVNFEKENVYGNHKEQLEPMFEKQVCPIYSLSNDKTTYGSKIGKSSKNFFRWNKKIRVEQKNPRSFCTIWWTKWQRKLCISHLPKHLVMRQLLCVFRHGWSGKSYWKVEKSWVEPNFWWNYQRWLSTTKI